mmetsp:Transcript_99757/g.321438  ORF Transcript_99757/g.321438 Transcript_99757/m.321438 type:complete len:251 (+) Transcript_99757:1065-1817(+)
MKPRHKLETQVSACNDLWQANGNTIVATNTSTRFLGMHSQGCAERQRLRNGKSSADWEANGTSSSSSCSCSSCSASNEPSGASSPSFSYPDSASYLCRLPRGFLHQTTTTKPKQVTRRRLQSMAGSGSISRLPWSPPSLAMSPTRPSSTAAAPPPPTPPSPTDTPEPPGLAGGGGGAQARGPAAAPASGRSVTSLPSREQRSWPRQNVKWKQAGTATHFPWHSARDFAEEESENGTSAIGFSPSARALST